MLEGFGGEAAPLFDAQLTAGQGVGHPIVVCGIDHDGDRGEVFGRRSQHGRPADVDVLQRVIQRYAGLADGCCEGIEVDYHQVDGINTVLLQLGHVAGRIPPRQQAAVDGGMQGLDATFQNLRRTGNIRHLANDDPGIRQAPVRAAGANQFAAGAGQPPAQIFDTRFVIDAD